MKLLIILSFFTSTSASVVSLNPNNYDELTWGKNVFIKYFAPWCGHCQAMASDWETLASQWASNKDCLIGEVDCDNDDNEKMCKEAGVTGFPTLMFGTADSAKEYTGARDITALNMFVETFLKPICSERNIDLCSDEIKAAIEKYQKMNDDELRAIIKKVKTAERVSDDVLQLHVMEIKKKYDSVIAEKKMKVKKAKDESDFSLVSEILESRGIQVDKDDNDEDDEDEDDDDDDDDEDEDEDEVGDDKDDDKDIDLDAPKPKEIVIDFNDLKRMGGQEVQDDIRAIFNELF